MLRAYWYIPCGREQELKPLTEWDARGFITGALAPKTKERARMREKLRKKANFIVCVVTVIGMLTGIGMVGSCAGFAAVARTALEKVHGDVVGRFLLKGKVHIKMENVHVSAWKLIVF